MTENNSLDIRVVCFAGSLDVDLLPHFLAHYRQLGARRFHFVLHGDFSAATLSDLAGQSDIVVEEHVFEAYGDFLQSRCINRVLGKLLGKWVFHVDIDEFVELPYRNVGRTIAALQVFGSDALPAYMLQRVAADGELAALSRDQDIWDVYPCADFNLSERMGVERATWKSKYPLLLVSDRTVRKRGNHLPPNDWPAERAPLRAVVHHFKWRDVLLKSLQNKRQEESGVHEYDAYSAWLSVHDNRLPIDNARRLTRDDLFSIGLLTRADRRNLRVYSLLRRIRTSRDAPGFPSRSLQRVADDLFYGNTSRNSLGRGAGAVKPNGLFARPGKICFVTFELMGPTNTGGIGTAISALAELLSAFGHDVHVLFCPHMGHGTLHELWHEMWNARGVTLHYLPQRTKMETPEPPREKICSDVADYLSNHSFDLVHFHENGGIGSHVALLSKSTIALSNTKVCVSTHGPQAWHKQGNFDTWWQSENDIAEFEISMMRSADLVLSPSQYMLDWIGENMTDLKQSVVVRNVLPGSSRMFRRQASDRQCVDEIVFFGRLETRKGLDRFLMAIDRLKEIDASPFTLTFLGRVADQKYVEQVEDICKKHGIDHEIISNLGTVEAVNYLRCANCVVVIPSRLDNLPYTIYECLENGIPVITSSVGGIPELIDASDQENILQADEPEQLANALSRLLRDGTVPGSLAFDSARAELENIAVHSQLVDEARTSDTQDLDFSDVAVVIYGDEARGVPGLYSNRLKKWAADGVGIFIFPPHMDADHPLVSEVSSADRSGHTPEKRMHYGNEAGFLGDVAELSKSRILVFCHTQVIAEDDALGNLVAMLRSTHADAVVVGYRFGIMDAAGSAMTRSSNVILSLSLPVSSAAAQNIFGTGLFAVGRGSFDDVEPHNLIEGDREFFHWKALNQIVARGGEVMAIPSALATRIVSSTENWDGRVTREHWNVLLNPWAKRVPSRLRPAIYLAAERQSARTSDVDHLRNFINDDDWRSLTDEDSWLDLVREHNWLVDMFRYGYHMEMKHTSDLLKNSFVGRVIRRPGFVRTAIGRILGV